MLSLSVIYQKDLKTMSDSAITFRLKAFAYHLLISIIIALISLYVVFIVWHPAPLAQAVGVTVVFVIMLGIDMVLGPVLTLIVAKQGKKLLKLDLAVIIILQLAALVYGMYNIAMSRPVYIAFDTSRFEVVQANEIPKESLEQAEAPYSTLGWGTPKYVAVREVKNDEEKSARLFSELETGVAPSKQPDLYEPLDGQWAIISAKAHQLTKLSGNNSTQSIIKVKQDHPSATGWLPLVAYEQDMVVLVDIPNKTVVDIVDLRP